MPRTGRCTFVHERSAADAGLHLAPLGHLLLLLPCGRAGRRWGRRAAAGWPALLGIRAIAKGQVTCGVTRVATGCRHPGASSVACVVDLSNCKACSGRRLQTEWVAGLIGPGMKIMGFLVKSL
eukprot:278335-Chlamydomonas_euryale.AAC.17